VDRTAIYWLDEAPEFTIKDGVCCGTIRSGGMVIQLRACLPTMLAGMANAISAVSENAQKAKLATVFVDEVPTYTIHGNSVVARDTVNSERIMPLPVFRAMLQAASKALEEWDARSIAPIPITSARRG